MKKTVIKRKLLLILCLVFLSSCSNNVYYDSNLLVVYKRKQPHHKSTQYTYKVINEDGQYFWLRTNKVFEYGDLIQILKKDEKNSN